MSEVPLYLHARAQPVLRDRVLQISDITQKGIFHSPYGRQYQRNMGGFLRKLGWKRGLHRAGNLAEKNLNFKTFDAINCTTRMLYYHYKDHAV